MPTFIKRFSTLGYIACLLFLISVSAKAQNTSQHKVNVEVSAKIVSSIKMITQQTINLIKEKAVDGRITVNPRLSSNAGKMKVLGTPNADFRISFLNQKLLSRSKSNETLQFTYKVSGNTDNDQKSSEVLRQDNRDFSFNKKGIFYLWIGGNVDISSASPGNYRGEFTLDIEYI